MAPTPLISPELLVYHQEQVTTNYCGNIVPVWDTIVKGNWNLLNQLIRKASSEYNAKTLATAGTIKVLELGKPFYLVPKEKGPNWGIAVPKFLYMAFIIPSQDKGLACLVYNNIHDKKMNKKDIHLCKPIELMWTLYPEFLDAKNGYTYCCEIDDFIKIVPKLK